MGARAPWAALSEQDRRPTKSELVRVVADYQPFSPPAVAVGAHQPSAVLMVLAGSETDPEILLTRRAWHLRSHKGEISFPGGRLEEQDASLMDAALREANEEVGLAASTVEIVGELDRMYTVSSSALIVPFVAEAKEPLQLEASDDEVDAILSVSVSELLDPQIFRSEVWPFRAPGDDLQDTANKEIEITFFELQSDTLWGATARMIRNLFEAYTRRRLETYE